MGQKGCRFSLFLFSPVQVGPTVVVQQRLMDSLFKIKLKRENVGFFKVGKVTGDNSFIYKIGLLKTIFSLIVFMLRM